MIQDEFRAAMRRFPTGVTVVTTAYEGFLKGFTANAFSSVSLDPPMVLVCVNRQARSHPLISQAGKFCVNILALEQEGLALRFSDHFEPEPFAGVAYHFGTTGAPVLDDVIGYLDCELSEEHSAGTHTIFLGTVVDCGSRAGEPLGYFNAGYRNFQCEI